MFSERVNPWMGLVKATAEALRQSRAPLPEDHPALMSERALLAHMGEGLAAWRKGRDAWLAHVFGALFGAEPLGETSTPASKNAGADLKERTK